MTQISSGRLRTAKAEDGAQLLRLWALLFDEGGTTSEELWKGHIPAAANAAVWMRFIRRWRGRQAWGGWQGRA